MVVVSYSGKEINAKIVYYGPGLGGKTTNLEQIYESVPAAHKGKMISMKTKADRTLFFDFLPIDLGDISGFRTRFMLYTVPGQVYYNATRKLVLKGVDAVVFVADSERGKMRENQESLENLRDNLRDYGIDIAELPIVFQYNKRDLRDVYTTDELDAGLGRDMQPMVEAVAAEGPGVLETLREVSALLLRKLRRELGPGQSGTTSGAVREPAAPPVAAVATPTAPAGATPAGIDATPAAPRAPEKPVASDASMAPPVGPAGSRPASPPPFEPSPVERAPVEASPSSPHFEVVRFGGGETGERAAGAAPAGPPVERPVALGPAGRADVVSPRAADVGETTASDTARRIVVPVEIDLDRVEAGDSIELVIELRPTSQRARRTG
jgi:signal recognition particle receptor subunit beta